MWLAIFHRQNSETFKNVTKILLSPSSILKQFNSSFQEMFISLLK